jgi:SAM-dependent methyltransferase
MSREHWERVYSSRPSSDVSWFQRRAERSLALIQASGIARSDAIIDVGGGASTLVDDLLVAGYTALTVLDISSAALATARDRLGPRAGSVTWLQGDVTELPLPARAYALWHDRAVFHFLATSPARRAYVLAAGAAVKPGGHLIVATFAEDGPARCSGLPVVRYSPEQLHAQFGAEFTLLGHEREVHRTPSGATQNFIFCHWRRNAAD